jgi:hypothetical protein
MGKAFTTAVRWLAPLGAILTARRVNPATLNDANLDAQAGSPASQRSEVAVSKAETGSGLIGIAIQQNSSPSVLDARAERTDRRIASATPLGQTPTTPNLRPLRVLRIRESGPHPRRAGRLVISGRMADVCAELERLAAAHPGLVH